MTKKELAELVGISEQRIHSINAELPDDKKLFKKGAEVDLGLFIRRWAEYKSSNSGKTVWQKKDLAKLAGYSVQRMGEFEKEWEDSSFFVKSNEGGYDLALFVQRWVQFREERVSNSGDEYNAVRTAHERIKTEKTQLEVDKIRGMLVDAAEVELYWMDIANTIKQGFVQFAAHTAPLIVGMNNVDEVRDVIDKEARRILESLSVNALPNQQGDEDEEQ